MNAHVVLLRGVNVGGKRKVSMAELQAALVAAGFVGARTLLNSGNVILRSDLAPAALETLLESEAHGRMGLRTDFHVRSAAEWRALIDANPLPDAAARNPSHFIVVCLKSAPTPAGVEALRAANPGPEVIHAVGRQLYIDYGGPATMRESKLTPNLMDSRLGTRGTGRNWNTMLKLAALAAS